MDLTSLVDSYLLPAGFSFILCVLLVLGALKLFPKLGLMDRPLKYGLQRAPIPYYGGVAIFTAFVLSSIIFVPISKEFLGLILGAVLIVGVGFFDDLLDLSPMIRMLVQVLAAIVLVGFGVGILSVNLPFIGVLDFTGWELNGVFVWSALFTVFWVVIILNTMNFIDGVSGLSSGVTFIAGLTLFVLSIHPGVHENPQSQEGVAIIAIVLAMVAFAFLLFDFPRPRILMGDSGSTFFGFMIAALAIFSGGKVATAFLVLGIPILDMVWVVLRRLFSGQKIWKGDLKHLHHRLLNLGFSKRQVVLMYLLVTALLGVLAVSLVSLQQKLFILIALILMMVLLASALVFIPKRR